MNNVCIISFGDISRPKNGYHIRTLMLARKIKNEGNNVTVYQFNKKNDSFSVDGIQIISLQTGHQKKTRIRIFFENIISFDPFSIVFFEFEGYYRLWQRRKEFVKYSQFYIEGALLINGFIFVKKYKRTIILDTHCINKDVALKMLKINKIAGGIRTIIWHMIEKSLLKRSNYIITVSDEDKKFIEKHYKIDTDIIKVIPNEVGGANLNKFKETAVGLRESLKLKTKYLSLFIGDLGAVHNKEAEKYIRNYLAPSCQNITFLMIGNNPNNFKNCKNIIYQGFVEDVDPYIIMSDFCIAPLEIGSGTKTKVLDYLKYNKYIVATPIALEGIDTSNHDNIFISSVGQFINIINKKFE